MAISQHAATGTASESTRSKNIHLPPPQTFDILPALHELLARIEHNSIETGATAEHNDSSESSSDIGALYTDLPPLEPKELPTEVLHIKAKIRNAVKELQKLPDMSRSIEEQQVEIEELEGRIARQKAMIKQMAEAAKDVEGKLG